MPENSLPRDICNKILQNRYNDPKIEFVKSEISPISEDAEGYMGEHLNLNITYKLNNKTSVAEFFMKRKPTKNPVQIEAAENTGVYKKEIFLYEKLLKEFEKYGYDISFASKMYYCIPEEAMILENLKLNGYQLFERNTVFNKDRMKSLLKSLALFHAAGYAYEKIKTKEMGKEFKLGTEYKDFIEEIFYVQYINPEGYSMKFWKGCMTTISALIDVIPGDEKFIKKFKTTFENYKFGKIFVDETNVNKTCGHGDLWSNNMMFKEKNGVLECKLLDFQILRYFYPTFDIILAIYCNSDKDFRSKYLQEMYEYYYEVLSKTVEKYGHNIEDFLTKNDFNNSLELVKPDALLQVTFTNSLICIPKEKLNGMVETEDGMNELIFGNEKMTIEAFKNDEKYRTILMDSLYELYDSMLANEN